MNPDLDGLPSPCYLLDEAKLRANLELIDEVQKAVGCRVLLALKGFAMWSVFPLVRRFLSGCAVSSLNEALLAKQHFGGHLHLYAPAYSPGEFPRLLDLTDRISFNSLSQWRRLGTLAQRAGISCGLRVNPGINEVVTDLYNPCLPRSRLGIPQQELKAGLPEGIQGLHVHALCESAAEATARLIDTVEEKFHPLLGHLRWLNLGGGHLMTRTGYDMALLIHRLHAVRTRYPHLELILEPGSAIAWDSGQLVSTVLDLIERDGIHIALLDISATAHMPDVLEMPYRPEVRGGGAPEEKASTYRLGGLSCLAGDVIGDYSFDLPLEVGDRLVFEDMIHYTMVKSTLFNGVSHPAIAIRHEDGRIRIVRRFDYADYESRLS